MFFYKLNHSLSLFKNDSFKFLIKDFYKFLILLIFTIILSDIVNKLHIFNAIIEIAVI